MCISIDNNFVCVFIVLNSNYFGPIQIYFKSF